MSVRYERRGAAAWVTFERPEAHNALTYAMYDRLVECCEAADADAGVRALVLRGAGGRAFVAGTDIRQFAAFETAADGLAYERRIDAVVARLEDVRKPTVALVDGIAMGSGLVLAATCDLRVCTPDASFGMPIARTVGNCLSMANSARLAAILGEARLKALIFLARTIGAEEALALGLATEVVATAGVEARVGELCELLASHSPTTLAVTKAALRRLRPLPDGDDLILEAYGSDGFRENVRRFLAR
jgi:enoyl-CoA hydratase/carnithine racemase